MMQSTGEILDDAVGVGIIVMRADLEIAVPQTGRKYAPMRRVRLERLVMPSDGLVSYFGHVHLPGFAMTLSHEAPPGERRTPLAPEPSTLGSAYTEADIRHIDVDGASCAHGHVCFWW
jgi:hypothetical protein